MPEVHLNQTTTKSGTFWQARWTINGVRHTRGLGNVEKVSRAKATRMCREIERDGGAAASDSIEAVKTIYLDSIDVTDQVRDNRKRVLGLLTAEFGEKRDLSSITRQDAGAFVDTLKRRTVRRTVKGKVVDDTVDPNTVATQVGILRMFFAEACARDYCAVNPFDRVKAKKVRKDLFLRVLTDTEFASILDACPDRRWRCMFALCRWAGLRAGEAKRVRWSDVRWDKGTLAVNAPDEEDDSKAHDSKHHERHPPIVPALMAELQGCYDELGGDGPCDGLSAQPSRWGKTIVKRAGVAGYGEVFQGLRRMAVIDWQEKYPALAVAGWIGHDIKIAAKHYYAPSEALIAQVAGHNITNPSQTEPTKNPTR